VHRLYIVNFVDMWGLKACSGKIRQIRPSEIEFESTYVISAVHHRI